MKTPSSLSRGLLYGGIFAGVMCVFPMIALILSAAPLGEIALAGGMIVGIWGTLGFLAGFCSHSEHEASPAGSPHPASETSPVKRLLYRFVAGMLLSYIAGMIVSGLGLAFYALWEAGFLGAPNSGISDGRRHLIFIAFCGWVGAEGGSIGGCWVGAMLARGGNVLGPIAKISLVSGALGVLAGGWLGALIGILCFSYLRDFSGMIAIAAASAGALAGIAAAVFMRVRVY